MKKSIVKNNNIVQLLKIIYIWEYNFETQEFNKLYLIRIHLPISSLLSVLEIIHLVLSHSINSNYLVFLVFFAIPLNSGTQ